MAEHDAGAAAALGARLGLVAGMAVQELGWAEDSDETLRTAIEAAINDQMFGPDDGEVVDVVVLWWRDGDGDLVDGLMDALTDVVSGGPIWLLTPKVGRPLSVDPADIAESAPDAGLVHTTSFSVGPDWVATKLVSPKGVPGGRPVGS